MPAFAILAVALVAILAVAAVLVWATVSADWTDFGDDL